MSDDIVEENTALWVRNANQAETIARLRDESDGQFRRIAELEVELAQALRERHEAYEGMKVWRENCTRAEARLAAVVALANTFTENNILRETIIAAATGETT